MVPVLALPAFFCGCKIAGNASLKTARPQWSPPLHGLSVRLIVRDVEIRSGHLPRCKMQVRNVSDKTILVSKAFAWNGPAVYDERGESCPHIIYLEVLPGQQLGYHRLLPRAHVSVETKPNYEMRSPGRYTLYFAIGPDQWGYEDPNRPGEIPRPVWGNEEPVVSNKVLVTVIGDANAE